MLNAVSYLPGSLGPKGQLLTQNETESCPPVFAQEEETETLFHEKRCGQEPKKTPVFISTPVLPAPGRAPWGATSFQPEPPWACKFNAQGSQC